MLLAPLVDGDGEFVGIAREPFLDVNGADNWWFSGGNFLLEPDGIFRVTQFAELDGCFAIFAHGVVFSNAGWFCGPHRSPAEPV
jgi:hypothetical protein